MFHADFLAGPQKRPLLNGKAGSYERADTFDFAIGERQRLGAESHDRFHPTQPQHGYTQRLRVEACEYVAAKHGDIDHFGAIRPHAFVLVGWEESFDLVERRQAVTHAEFVSWCYC